MARQGRFGRPTAGTQNLSALIYALLKEERTDQENTMLRAYTNNMQGGTTRNTFSSGGSTSSATAASVYQWYLSQANLAQSQGDNAGYTSLLQKAEDFRLQSLRDQETVLSNAYNNGTSIDRGLFGMSGVGTLTVGEYETLLGAIAVQPGMTEADISRIQRSIFSASYDSAAADIVRQYNEKKVSADKLVSFYDKELERAKTAGVPQDSARYQGILDARSRAIAAKKADIAQSRYDLVTNRIKDEKKALAIALQKFIAPVLERMFTSKNTVKSLNTKITDDGEGFIATLVDVLNSSRQGMLTELLSTAGTAAGASQSDIETLLIKVGDYSDEINRLKDAGYGEEVKSFSKLANYFNEGIAAGAFSVVSKNASSGLAKDIAATGGVLATPLSSDPYATATSFDRYVAEMSRVSSSDKFDDILIADQVASIGSGDLGILLPGMEDASLNSVISTVASETKLDEEDVIQSMIALMGNQNAWNQNDSNLIKVGGALKRAGLDVDNLSVSTSMGGEMTVGIVARLALEKEMTRRVDADPNLVWTYRRTGPTGYTYVASDVASITNSDYAVGSSSSNKNQVIYIERVPMKYADQNNVADAQMFYVAVPGGGDLSNGQMDSNDYVEFNSGTLKMRLTREDLDDFATYAAGTGGDFMTPIVDGQTGQIRIGKGLVEQLTSGSNTSQFKLWLETTAAEKGDAWYQSKFSSGKGGVSLQGGAVDLVTGYINDLNTSLGPNIDPNARKDIVDKAVDKYIIDNGISDKTGKIKSAIVAGLEPPKAEVFNTTPTAPIESGYPTGYSPQAPLTTAPPAPSYVSPYALQQTGGAYTVPTAPTPGSVGSDPSAFFFRKAPGREGSAIVPTISPAPPPEVVPVPTNTALPVIKLSGTPVGGTRGAGRIAL